MIFSCPEPTIHSTSGRIVIRVNGKVTAVNSDFARAAADMLFVSPNSLTVLHQWRCHLIKCMCFLLEAAEAQAAALTYNIWTIDCSIVSIPSASAHADFRLVTTWRIVHRRSATRWEPCTRGFGYVYCFCGCSVYLSHSQISPLHHSVLTLTSESRSLLTDFASFTWVSLAECCWTSGCWRRCSKEQLAQDGGQYPNGEKNA